MHKTILILIIAVFIQGCCRYDIDEVLLQREDISLTFKGDLQFAYNPLNCQLGYNDTDNEYRVYNDLLSDWFIIKCSSKPDTEGQTVNADLIWTTSSSIRKENGLSFIVQKTDDKGQVWMWNKSKRIGIVIKNL